MLLVVGGGEAEVVLVGVEGAVGVGVEKEEEVVMEKGGREEAEEAEGVFLAHSFLLGGGMRGDWKKF